MQDSDSGTSDLLRLVEKINNDNKQVLLSLNQQVDRDIVSIISGLYKRAEQKELLQELMSYGEEDDPKVHP